MHELWRKFAYFFYNMDCTWYDINWSWNELDSCLSIFIIMYDMKKLYGEELCVLFFLIWKKVLYKLKTKGSAFFNEIV